MLQAYILLGTLLSVVLGRELPHAHASDLTPIGSHWFSEHRNKRSVDDRGAQNVYYVSRTPGVWGTAWLTCRQAMNGQLLTIETEAEDQFVRDLLIENHIDSVWTSGAFDAELGVWRWVATGGEISNTNWITGQPSANDESSRIAVQNSLFSHGWKTVGEDSLGHYICEVRSGSVEQPTVAPPTTDPPPSTEPPPESTTYVHIDPPPELEGEAMATDMPMSIDVVFLPPEPQAS